ncbi:MAG: hypothetical protein M3010_09485 [Candidatus Dormibacteraeota bacterium]|nr:hypothetical protein [Candidatus Dormibacteraeota bacterium]
MTPDEPTLITTDEAGRLTNRSPNAIRRLVSSGALQYAAFNDQRRPLLDRTEVIEWNRAHPAIPKKTSRPWLNTLVALRFLGPATTQELAVYLHIHPGNVRKHLRLLAASRDVVRLSDRQWAAAVSVDRGDLRQDPDGSWYVHLANSDDVDKTAAVPEPSAVGAA